MSSDKYESLRLECGDGWRPLIRRTLLKLEEVSPGFSILQIKEKFGLLRMHLSGLNEEGFLLVSEAECESGSICEVCGEPGTMMYLHHWASTLCEEHRGMEPWEDYHV